MDDGLKEALLGNHESRKHEPLADGALQEQVEELRPYLSMVDEMGRFALLRALDAGKIDVEEFKSRALRNDPRGDRR